MVEAISIAGRLLGVAHPCFIIAEAGVNHDGSLEKALELVDVAAVAGADAVKFQTFSADRLVSPDAPKANYQIEPGNTTETQLEMLRRLELSAEAHQVLLDRCAARGLFFLSTPFDEESADFLLKLGVVAFKLPSGELTNLPFLEHVARLSVPMIVSTGMSNLDEVRAAVDAVYSAGNKQLILLHCVSNYPAAAKDINLRAMDTMRDEFDLPVGYSDHTLGTEVALAAVARGACVIEKHFTLDPTRPGPDHRASLNPEQLHALVRGVRNIESALGDGRKIQAASEKEMATVARKSLVATVDISSGASLTEEMIGCKRPGSGLPPAMRGKLVGRRARVAIHAGELLREEMFL